MRRLRAIWPMSRTSGRSRSRGTQRRKPSSHSSWRKNALQHFDRQDRKRIPVLLGFFLFSLITVAQELPTAKPETVGLSSERLDRISSVVQQDIEQKRIAGAVTLVIRHGKVAWF